MNSFVSGTLSTLFSIYVYRLFVMFREIDEEGSCGNRRNCGKSNEEAEF